MKEKNLLNTLPKLPLAVTATTNTATTTTTSSVEPEITVKVQKDTTGNQERPVNVREHTKVTSVTSPTPTPTITSK